MHSYKQTRTACLFILAVINNFTNLIYELPGMSSIKPVFSTKQNRENLPFRIFFFLFVMEEGYYSTTKYYNNQYYLTGTLLPSVLNDYNHLASLHDFIQ